jgi:hypothetical protein
LVVIGYSEQQAALCQRTFGSNRTGLSLILSFFYGKEEAPGSQGRRILKDHWSR